MALLLYCTCGLADSQTTALVGVMICLSITAATAQNLNMAIKIEMENGALWLAGGGDGIFFTRHQRATTILAANNMEQTSPGSDFLRCFSHRFPLDSAQHSGFSFAVVSQ